MNTLLLILEKEADIATHFRKKLLERHSMVIKITGIMYLLEIWGYAVLVYTRVVIQLTYSL